MESGHLFFNTASRGSNMIFLGNGDLSFRGRSMMSMEESSKRRPFFSSPDELFDDEYYEELLPEKKRRLTSEQVHLLEKNFEEENKLEPDRKTELAKKLGLQPRQVAVWFQNRRARWKTKQLERDYDVLKASYDSLLSSYDSIVKDNEKLQSEVVSLQEKLKVEAKEIQREEPTSEKKAETVVALDIAQITGSVNSAIVDEGSPQIVVESVVDSYFPAENYVMAAMERVQSEEDDGSDDGTSYFSDVFVAHQNEQLNNEALGWWSNMLHNGPQVLF